MIGSAGLCLAQIFNLSLERSNLPAFITAGTLALMSPGEPARHFTVLLSRGVQECVTLVHSAYTLVLMHSSEIASFLAMTW